MTTFTKQPDGAWRFESPTTGRTYEALHNARRFNGRGWTLREVWWSPVSDGKYHEMRGEAIADILPTRRACVEYALLMERTTP